MDDGSVCIQFRNSRFSLFRVIEFEALLAASVGAKSIAISGKLRLVLLQAVQTFSSQELIYSHVVIVIMHPFS